MKTIKNYTTFVNESKTNLYEETTNDIKTVADLLVKGGFEQEDEWYFTIDTPFIVTPDAKNEEWKTKISLVLFTDLLSYSSNYKEEYKSVGQQLTPWVVCRTEIENGQEHEEIKKILEWLKNKIEESTKLKPFQDEDAYLMYWKKEEGKDYTKYSCFINPSYPEGWWENHTLE